MYPTALPRSTGAGFKPQHFADIAKCPLTGGFLEVHAENYMGAGGPPHAMLERLREDYALSIHGVGLSIGGEEPLSREHLMRLRSLCDRYRPESFSEHLAWSSHGGEFLADLLPLPYTAENLTRVCDHIDEVQTALGRAMLLENPATYLTFEESDIPETAFLREIAARTGCGLLLDVNNVFVSSHNHNFDAGRYLDDFPIERVGEIHLAGHYRHDAGDAQILIDAHGSPVAGAVWSLYAGIVTRTGAIPTLIEWDNDVPEWSVLHADAMRADSILRASSLKRSA